jgi:hypothetical protein
MNSATKVTGNRAVGNLQCTGGWLCRRHDAESANKVTADRAVGNVQYPELRMPPPSAAFGRVVAQSCYWSHSLCRCPCKWRATAADAPGCAVIR